MTVQKFSEGMRKHFGVSGAQIIVCPSTFYFKEAHIDVIKFDGWLHLKFGEYELDEKVSMKQLIKKKFGKEAMLFIQSLI